MVGVDQKKNQRSLELIYLSSWEFLFEEELILWNFSWKNDEQLLMHKQWSGNGCNHRLMFDAMVFQSDLKKMKEKVLLKKWFKIHRFEIQIKRKTN